MRFSRRRSIAATQLVLCFFGLWAHAIAMGLPESYVLIGSTEDVGHLDDHL